MSILNKREIGAKHAHSGHERPVSDDDIISTQDSIDLIVRRRFPSDQQPGLIQLNRDISRKHWRHWEAQETKETRGVRSRNTPYRQPHRESNAVFPLKSLFTAMRAPTSELGGNWPAKQSPTVKEGRKFRGAPPLKCFFRVSYVTFQEGKKLKWMRHFCDEVLLWVTHIPVFAHGYLRLEQPSEPKQRRHDTWTKAAALSSGSKHPESEANNSHTPPSVVSSWIHVVTGDAPTSLLQDTLMLYRVTAWSPGTS